MFWYFNSFLRYKQIMYIDMEGCHRQKYTWTDTLKKKKKNLLEQIAMIHHFTQGYFEPSMKQKIQFSPVYLIFSINICKVWSLVCIIFFRCLFGSRFRMRVQCVISCGLTQMTDVGGEYLLEVQDTHLGRISLHSLTTIMGSLLFLELTNLLWKDTIGARFVKGKQSYIWNWFFWRLIIMCFLCFLLGQECGYSV